MSTKARFKIPFGCFVPIAAVIMLCNGYFCVNILGAIIRGPTPTPTLSAASIQNTAVAEVSLKSTQTAEAIPTFTFTFTAAPSSTNTPLLPTSTNTFVPTATIAVPTQPPVGSQCICSYDTYNCSDSLAVTCFNYCTAQGYGDIHKLDRDDDGYACEG